MPPLKPIEITYSITRPRSPLDIAAAAAVASRARVQFRLSRDTSMDIRESVSCALAVDSAVSDFTEFQKKSVRNGNNVWH